ncbi:alpha/beta hydrolase fold domain-containing protein [Ideonella sp. DXS22W]|uniref:Alpha/beta hydrolase fold domain-containing protein n=1 Tax=Pseudaquabacterium inlustre TaxID=2984192 RepID=A0ABU9CG69_9BURK
MTDTLLSPPLSVPSPTALPRASWQARLATWLVRRRVKPALGDLRDIARVRRAFGQPLPHPRGVQFQPAELGGVPGEWVVAEPVDAADEPATPTLLYLHGGGFVGCSPRTHRPLTAALARQGLRVFVPDYRLAPEHPFPAAPDDALAVWRALVAQHAATGRTGRITVGGDSAGGNLALGLMQRLRDQGERLPDAGVLFSPALDMTGGSASLLGNAERDAMFRGDCLGALAEAYLQGADPAQPLASPLLGGLAGLPPLLVHVGCDEALRDDSLRLADGVRAAGGRIALQVWPAVSHVWQLIWRLPEARRSVAQAGRFLREAAPRGGVEHHDVLIVGAGLSGVGAAAHLQMKCPDLSVALLEARPAIGGTWDLFRYPGVRSDSDMYTLGYAFKPWTDAKAIADGPSIRRYIAETAAERGIDRRIRHGHRVLRAEWCSADARWTLDVERQRPDGPPERLRMSCNFLQLCAGYYSYAEGHRPQWEGEAEFRGRLVHPQFWPQDLDHTGKNVVVIGSGATAVTLVPEMAKTAAHVTMLQRSPTYVVALPGTDALAEWLKHRLPPRWAYRLVRAKNVLRSLFYYRLARKYPEQTKQRLVGLVQQQVGSNCDVAAHFTPRYMPWDQRVCVVPDGDMFSAIQAGRASVVTDQIARFTPGGIQLASGSELPADIVVTATGLKLNVMGDIGFSLDGRPIDFGQAMTYKGMMLADVPNLAYTFGYTNASWTLKADLTSDYVCRLLQRMRRQGTPIATPRGDPAMPLAPFLDFTSGYVQRALPLLPKQGAKKPWRLYQNYLLDTLMLRFGRIDDGILQRSRPAPR